ncbi:hypothetical protein GEMRC1_005213 [Eukaryota sp. GEM-RC1]
MFRSPKHKLPRKEPTDPAFRVHPLDVYVSILHHLPISDVIRSFTISSRFATAASTVLDDKTRLSFHREYLLSPSFFSHIHEVLPNLHHISFQVPHLNRRSACYIGGILASSFLHLRSLLTVSLYEDSPGYLTQCFIDKYPIDRLSFFHCDFPHLFHYYFSSDNVDLTAHIHLQNYYLPHSSSIDSVMCIVPRLPSLRELSCSANHFGYLSSDHVPFELISNLEVLRINGKLTVESSKVVGQLENLKHLEIFDMDVVTSHILNILHNLSFLKIPNIPWDFSFDISLPILIESLHLNDLSKSCSLRKLVNLSKLSIIRCPSVLDASTLVNFSQLMVLSIANVIPDSILSMISVDCHHLKEVNFRLTTMTSPTILLSVIINCSHVTLRGHIPDLSSIYTTINPLVRLRHLSIHQEDEECLGNYWLRIAPNLKYVFLSNVAISSSFVESLEFLHALNLVDCSVELNNHQFSKVELSTNSKDVSVQIFSQYFNSLGCDFWSISYTSSVSVTISIDSISELI